MASTGLGLPREECSPQIPVLSVPYKKNPNPKPQTKHHRTNEWNILIPKCSRKGMGNGNITIHSEDSILALMFFPCDLDLSFLSIPLFSVWVWGQEHRKNWFSPFFFLLFPLVKLTEQSFFLSFKFFFLKEKVARKPLHSLVWENQVSACFYSSDVKCCYCWTEWLFL